MMKQNYQAYKQQSVMTMTSTEMLTMLYDGILKELYLVEKAFEVKNYEEINRGLQKVQRILNHLKTTLDMNYDIAKNLISLYDYFSWIVTQANLKKDPAKLSEVAEMVRELKESYIQADRKARMHA